MANNNDWPAWKMLSVLFGLFGGLGLILGLSGNWAVFAYFLIGICVFAVGGILFFVGMKIVEKVRDADFKLPDGDGDDYFDD